MGHPGEIVLESVCELRIFAGVTVALGIGGIPWKRLCKASPIEDIRKNLWAQHTPATQTGRTEHNIRN